MAESRKQRLARLRRSLALWRRKHRHRTREADIAHQRNDRAGVRKWYALMKQAGVQVRLRLRQIAAVKPKPAVSRRAKVIAQARRRIGVRETTYNGGGMITVWQRNFGFGRVPWCGIFCGAMMRSVGLRVSSNIASVALIEEMAKRRHTPFRGWTTDERNAFPGDLVVIGSYGQHVAMVERVHPDGSVSTIEGNCGNAVRRMHRTRGQIRGVAQVNY